MTTILGLDYGTKRIGVALAHTPLAEPLDVITNDDQTINAIKQLAHHHQVSLIIVGISEGNMAHQTKNFATKLRQSLHLPVKLADETLTSQETSERLKHKLRSFRSKPQDAYQAAIMLQRFLDSRNLGYDKINSDV